jgi:hypothetical protein
MIAIAFSLAVFAAGCTNSQWPWSPTPEQKMSSTAEPVAPAAVAEPVADEESPDEASSPLDAAVDDQTELAVREFLNDLEAAQEASAEATGSPRPADDPSKDAVELPAPVPAVAVAVADDDVEPRLQSNSGIEHPPPPAEVTGKRDAPSAPPRVLNVSLIRGDTLTAEAVDTTPIAAQRGLDVANHTEANLDRLIADAEEALKNDPIDARKQWQLSLLRLAAGKPDEAASLSPALSQESRALISRLVGVMGDAGQLLRDPPRGSDETLASVDALRDALKESAELTIPTVAFCTKVTNFGIYDEMPPGMLRPHQANNVIVYWEVKNCRMDETDDGRFHASLSSRLELFTSDGKTLWVDEQSRIEDYSKQRREDFFLAQLITLPANLAPGDYILKVSMTDLLASKTNQATHPFTIAGEQATAGR